MTHRFLYTAVAAAIMITAPAAGAEWLTDLDAAKAKAKAENKAVLVDFTGSDWCGWCIRLRSTILDTPVFQQYAADKFVLMEVDVPKNTAKIGAKQYARNKEITHRYGINIFPSILVLSAEGEVMGGFIGGRDTLEHVIAPLDAALSNYATITAARRLQGTARAKALMQVYAAQPDTLQPHFLPLQAEIAQYDPQNTTGIHTQIAADKRIAELEQLLQTQDTDYTRALAQFDKAYAEVPAAHKGKIQRMRSDYLERMQHKLIKSADTTADVQELKKLMLLTAEYSDPRDAEALQQEIELMFDNPEEVLKTLKQKQQAQ